MTNWQINYANQLIGLFLCAVVASVSAAHFTSNNIEQRTLEVVIKLFT